MSPRELIRTPKPIQRSGNDAKTKTFLTIARTEDVSGSPALDTVCVRRTTKPRQTAVKSTLAFELLELLPRIGNTLGAQAIDEIKRTPCPLIIGMLLVRSENQARHCPRIPVTPRPDVIGIAAEPVQELLAHDARESGEATKGLFQHVKNRSLRLPSETTGRGRSRSRGSGATVPSFGHTGTADSPAPIGTPLRCCGLQRTRTSTETSSAFKTWASLVRMIPARRQSPALLPPTAGSHQP